MRINKSLEVAKFSKAQGRFLSGREMYELGFRYSYGPTTADDVAAVLNKLHTSSLFVVQREIYEEKNRRRCRVLVLEIEARADDVLPMRRNLWRWLLTRAPV